MILLPFVGIVDQFAGLRLDLGCTRIALVVHDGLGNAVRPFAALAVDFMRVLSHGDHIVARFEHIAAFAFVIERRHILDVEGNRVGLRFAGLQQIGLNIVCQNDLRLFDAPLGVRCMIVNLHNVLACRRTGVRHIDGHDDLAVLFLCLVDLLLEGRIGETIAERINNRAVIVDEALRCRCLIITIADIDAFLILDHVRFIRRVRVS